MANNTYRSLPTEKVPDQYFPTTNALAKDIKNWPRTVTVVENTAVEEILADAVWRIDAQDHQNEGAPVKRVRNLGTAGPILDCLSGSTSVPDSNDPKFLDWNGTNYVYIPGGSTNALSIPDAANLDITGDIDLRAQVAMDDWTPTAYSSLIVKRLAGQVSYELAVNTGGELAFQYSVDGTNALTRLSTVATGLTDKTVKWVRATLDVDNGSSQNDVKFFTSDDGTSWTQLGSTVTNALTTSIFSGTAQVAIGAYSNLSSFTATAKIYRAQILNGINGTTVLDVDTSIITSGGATTFTAVTGQTVTINRSTTGRKTVAVTTPVWLFGTDDQLLVPGSATGSKAVDFSNNDSFTALVVMRQWNTNTTFRGILGKIQNPGSTTLGYYLWTSSPSTTIAFGINDGVTSVSRSGAFTNGIVSVFTGVLNRYVNTAQATTSTGILTTVNTSISNIGTLANTGVLTVGARGSGSANVDMEFVAAAIWRRPLSQAEITTLRTYYLDRWK
jgi:hypothetical protein